ncbi:MAG: hypothetical protein KKE97_13080 [Proteobacteria bacterium]|nr:hypothetical protein [Pseudomonadota bacterium]MBU4027863.1 hypothetical protein [Pseudomonadota bacterium]MBU4085476.1 hypothetical protein [Pseudomonadota bacterium]MBU4109271.1 hypothetical protein [Pseudomonadota bacterium]
METKTILTLIGFVVVLFGYIAVHRLSDWRSKRTELRTAVIAYKSAFAPEIAAISNNSFAINTFTIALQLHESAVDTIRPILPEDYQRKLQEAWDEYRGKDNNLGFDDFGFVQATSATFMLIDDKKHFYDFKKRFHNLHSCLDKLK